MDQGGQAGGEDDPPLLSPFSLEPSAAGAEPAGLQSGEFMAAADVAQANRELVADQLATTAGEDRRTAGETCPLLLAIAGRRASDAAAVRGHVRPDRAATDTDGIALGEVSRSESGYSGWGKEKCCKSGGIRGHFGLCCCGWQIVGSAPDGKSFYGVANGRDGYTMVPFPRSKRKFWFT